MSPSPEASPEKAAVTQLLIDWKSGKKEALDLLIPLVYQELRSLADRYLRDERAAATIQPTALVHEAYLRLVSQSLPDWESRAHFFGVAAHLMRQILVDHARRRQSFKRGSGLEMIRIEDTVSFRPRAWPPHPGTRRRTECARGIRRAQGESDGVALLWRMQCRRNGTGPRHFYRHHHSRATSGGSMASQGNGAWKGA